MRLLLIDAYSQIFRIFYALRELTNARGEPANALYGMARLFLQLHAEWPSEYGAIAFDHGKCTRRVGLLPDYKGTRPPMPEALRAQIAPIREWCEAFGWNIVQRDGFEADDLLAGLAAQRGDAQAIILTGDKDLAQLVQDPGVQLLQRGDAKTPWGIAGEAYVRQKFGVEPAQLIDYLALLGDTADNIPGLPGCGQKTAAQLLNTYGSIDGIREHLAELRPRIRDSFTAQAAALDRNRDLVRLDQALPEDWHGLEGIRRRAPDWKRLRALAADQGFKSILEAIDKADRPQQQMLF